MKVRGRIIDNIKKMSKSGKSGTEWIQGISTISARNLSEDDG